MTSAGTLLEQAHAVLAGDVRLPSEQRRAACWLARSALEEAAAAALLARGYEVSKTSMACRLACLDSDARLRKDDAALARARQARYAWIGLSRACHHHAYELAPTASEVRHLIGLVQQVAG